MVKIAFISDIHGNAVALNAVLEDIASKHVDQVNVLGDLCYRGPEPKRSLELVRSLQTNVIKGNADEWVVRGVREGEVPEKALEMMNIECDWTLSKLDRQDIDYLASLPTEVTLEHEGITIAGFHATPESLFEIIPPDSKDEVIEGSFFNAVNADVYIYAHIHKPYIRFIKGKIVMNIGSVGLPFDGMPKASYGLMEIVDGNIRASIERVQYDLEKTVQLYKDEDYPNAEMMIGIVRNGRI